MSRCYAILLALVLTLSCATRKPGDPLRPGFNQFSKEQDVEIGREAAEQFVFAQQCQQLVAGHFPDNSRRATGDAELFAMIILARAGRFFVRRRALEIGEQSVAQLGRFADVDKSAGLVDHAVNAGGLRARCT